MATDEWGATDLVDGALVTPRLVSPGRGPGAGGTRRRSKRRSWVVTWRRGGGEEVEMEGEGEEEQREKEIDKKKENEKEEKEK